MTILARAATGVIVQGITGTQAAFCVRDLVAYGTRVLGGVVPGRGGAAHEGVPVFDFVEDAARATGAEASLVFVPPSAASEAVAEAIEAGLRLVVYPGDGLPAKDAVRLRRLAHDRGAVLVGPNTAGLISPGQCKIGFMPSACFSPGRLGVISKSGSLSYEVASRLTASGIGQSTVVGVGGDPVKGLTIGEALRHFEADPETDAVLVLGEIGGVEELQAIAHVLAGGKPVVTFMVGRTAPEGRRLGHAGALIGSPLEAYQPKLEALEAGGIPVARRLQDIVPLVTAALRQVVQSAPGPGTGAGEEIL